VVIIYGGWPFLTGTMAELKARNSRMSTTEWLLVLLASFIGWV